MVSAWDRAFLSCGVGLDKVRDPQTFSRFLWSCWECSCPFCSSQSPPSSHHMNADLAANRRNVLSTRSQAGRTEVLFPDWMMLAGMQKMYFVFYCMSRGKRGTSYWPSTQQWLLLIYRAFLKFFHTMLCSHRSDKRWLIGEHKAPLIVL